MSQNNYKRPELQGRADLFSPELQHSSPFTVISNCHASLSHPLGAWRVIRTRNLALRSPNLPYPTQRGRQKAPEGRQRAPAECCLPAAQTAREAHRASQRHTQKCAGAPAPRSRFRVTWPGFRSRPPLLVETRPIGFLGLRGQLCCLQGRW